MPNRSILTAADQYRRIASRTPPWRVDGDTLLDSRTGQPLAQLEGEWTPDVAAYLTATSPYAGLALADLLWRIGQGHASAIEQAAVDLIKAMRLEG